MKKYLIPLVCLVALAACNKNEVPTWTNPDQNVVTPGGQAPALKVTPVITKVTETKFESGDAIGVTVTRAADVWAENQKLTFDGTVFAGELKWYEEGTEASTVTAYYPYASAVPTSFTVAADQSNGASASDLVAGSLSGVQPTAEAIVVPFQHKLSLIVLNVANNAGGELSSIFLDGAKLKANLAADFTATVDPDAAPASVKAYKKSATSYALILPPQTVVLTAKVVTAGANELTQKLAEATLEGGKKYTINMIVNPDNLLVVVDGDVQDWTDGGELDPEGGSTPAEPVQFEEHLTDGYFTYDNVQYSVVKLADGKWWMAQNLAFLPKGAVPSSDLTAVTAGVFYPVKVNDGNTAAEFDTSAAGIAAKGYLYQSEFALGLKVGDLTSVADAEALAGTQGICPDGWHIPSYDDYNGLVGKMNTVTNADAPYLSGSNAYITALNADGFDIYSYGAISIQDNTKTTGTFMGWMSSYPDKLSSGYIAGSSYAGVTYNTSGDATSGVKNLQFWGLMPMTNKGTEAEYTCNGTKLSYRIGVSVRCVRDAQ